MQFFLVDSNGVNIFPGLDHEGFDSFYICHVIILACPHDTLYSGNITDTTLYANNLLESDGLIPGANRVAFYSNNEILLKPNFEISDSVEFTAAIDGCLTPMITQGYSCGDALEIIQSGTFLCMGPDQGYGATNDTSNAYTPYGMYSFLLPMEPSIFLLAVME